MGDGGNATVRSGNFQRRRDVVSRRPSKLEVRRELAVGQVLPAGMGCNTGGW